MWRWWRARRHPQGDGSGRWRPARPSSAAGRLAAAALVGLLVVLSAPVAEPRPALADSGADAATTLGDVNQLRTSLGLAPLVLDPTLVAMAQGWSAAMAGADHLSHNPNLVADAPVGWQALGENVGDGGDATSVFNAFVASPPHHAALVNPAYTRVGIGAASGDGLVWITVDFWGGPAPTPTPVTSPPPGASSSGGPAPVAGSGGPSPAGPLPGYRLVTAGGDILEFGTSTALGHGAPGTAAMAATPDGEGAWLVTADGQVTAIGDARPAGSLTGSPTHPVVAVAGTADGGGYWLVAADGGVFAFGDARFFGSTGVLRLNEPIVAAVATPDGGGYWLVAADGGVFAFGDARFFGSTGALRLNQPIVAAAAAPDGDGYRLVAADGGVFSFGDVAFHGSAAGRPLSGPVVAVAAGA